MNEEKIWKKIKGPYLIFEFNPPKHWTDSCLIEACNEIAIRIKNIDKISASEEKGWIGLVKKLPTELIDILILELDSGNSIVCVNFCDWPNEGSVVITMGKKFTERSKKYSQEVSFSELNEPRSYCSEEILQIKDGVKHMLIY